MNVNPKTKAQWSHWPDISQLQQMQEGLLARLCATVHCRLS